MNKRKSGFILFILLIGGIGVQTLTSCSSDDSDGGGGDGGPRFTDSRDGQSYRIAVIGDQTWMAENLNYAAEGSKCYGQDGYVSEGGDVTLPESEVQANCAKYGRLYDWSTAMGIDASFNSSSWGGSDVNHQGICPDGWHVPSNDDWNELFLWVDEQNGVEGVSQMGLYISSTAGKYLKATSGWTYNGSSGNGTDAYGFSALPGGGGYPDPDAHFNRAGAEGVWWAASEFGSAAFNRYMQFYNDEANLNACNKSFLVYVRCVKDREVNHE